MGAPISVTMANLTMEHIERKALSSISLRTFSSLYRRLFLHSEDFRSYSEKKKPNLHPPRHYIDS